MSLLIPPPQPGAAAAEEESEAVYSSRANSHAPAGAEVSDRSPTVAKKPSFNLNGSPRQDQSVAIRLMEERIMTVLMTIADSQQRMEDRMDRLAADMSFAEDNKMVHFKPELAIAQPADITRSTSKKGLRRSKSWIETASVPDSPLRGRLGSSSSNFGASIGNVMHCSEDSKNTDAIGMRAGWALPGTWPRTVEPRLFSESALRRINVDDLVERVSEFLGEQEEVKQYHSQVAWGAKEGVDRFVLHPHGRFRMVFDCLSFLALLWDMMALPIMLAWDVPADGWLYHVTVLTLVFWTFDLFFNFRTGFYSNGNLVMEARLITARYLRTWFPIDFVVLVSNFFVLGMASDGDGTASSVNFLRVAKGTRIVRVVGMARLFRMSGVVRRMAVRHLGSHVMFLMDVPVLVFMLSFINHLIGCIWFAVGRTAESDTGRRWLEVDQGGYNYEEQTMAYQYLSAYHWSLTQMTPGSMNVQPENSTERLFNILCLLSGMVFFSSVISSLSTKFVQYRAMLKSSARTVKRLNKWLRHNGIQTKLAVSARMQAVERLRRTEDKAATVDKTVLDILPEKLQLQLYYEMCRTHLNHPIFRWWESMDTTMVIRACRQCMDIVVINDEHVLFHAGDNCSSAYVIVNGNNVKYTQNPETSKVVQKSVTNCVVGWWLSEAGLWSSWIHVGTIESETNAELLKIQADTLQEVVEHSTTSLYMFKEYCLAYHARVQSSGPPVSAFPSDLMVPFTSFEEILPSMGKASRELVAMAALQHLPLNNGKSVRLSVATNGETSDPESPKIYASNSPAHALFEQVRRGKCVVLLTSSGTLGRFVVVSALKVRRDDDRFLVEIGRFEDGKLKVNLKLPGGKQQESEVPLQVVDRVLQGWLRPFSQQTTLAESSASTERVTKMSKFGVKSTYLRVVHEAYLDSFEEDITANCRVSLPQMECNGEIVNFHDSFVATRQDTSGVETLEEGEEPEAAVFAWLSDEELEFFSGEDIQQQMQQLVQGVELEERTRRNALLNFCESGIKRISM